MGELGLGSGPPEPQVPPAPDEWMRRLSTLPLLYQPGERWLYNTGSDVLGVLIARAAGQPLEEFLRTRVFEPLGMVDTGFSTDIVDRLGSCYTIDPATGERSVFDPPRGQWATPPAFPSGAGGLVSTLDDMHAFGRMLLSGGRLPRRLAAAVPRVGRGDDHRSDRRGTRCSRTLARRLARVGLRRRCPGSPHGTRARRSGATGGPAGSARRGETTPTRTSSASC